MKIGMKKVAALAAKYESQGDYKAWEQLRSEYPRCKCFRLKQVNPDAHAQLRALHSTSEKAVTGLTGKQLRKETKALRHAEDGVKYNLPKPAKKHVGRRAKAKLAAKLAREESKKVPA